MEHDLMDDDELGLFLLGIVLVGASALLSQLDGRSFRNDRQQEITIRTNFWAVMKMKRSRSAYRRTVRCSPDVFDAIQNLLEPRYYDLYGDPGPSTRFPFDQGLAVLLTYYGNGCGQDGDGIGGAAAQIGMSRTSAGRYIKRLEYLLESMKDEIIYFPGRDDVRAWSELTAGFAERGGLFPDVACIFDGTIVKTTRPCDPEGFYDKSFTPAYNCLFACDRMRFRFLGVFTGSNSDQSMWNQSTTLGGNARYVCPPGVIWLADAGFKLLPFLMVPFDERGGKRLNDKHHCFNYHLSSTRMLVECAFGRLKGRFKVLHGVTNRKQHQTNARMIVAAAVLHNIMIDAGESEIFEVAPDEEEDLRRQRRTLNHIDSNVDRTQVELELALATRNAYMNEFVEPQGSSHAHTSPSAWLPTRQSAVSFSAGAPPYHKG